jgi:hypothetical protein
VKSLRHTRQAERAPKHRSRAHQAERPADHMDSETGPSNDTEVACRRLIPQRDSRLTSGHRWDRLTTSTNEPPAP